MPSFVKLLSEEKSCSSPEASPTKACYTNMHYQLNNRQQETIFIKRGKKKSFSLCEASPTKACHTNKHCPLNGQSSKQNIHLK